MAALRLPVSPDEQLVGGGQVAPLGPIQEVLVIRNVVVDQLQLLDGLLKPRPPLLSAEAGSIGGRHRCLDWGLDIRGRAAARVLGANRGWAAFAWPELWPRWVGGQMVFRGWTEAITDTQPLTEATWLRLVTSGVLQTGLGPDTLRAGRGPRGDPGDCLVMQRPPASRHVVSHNIVEAGGLWVTVYRGAVSHLRRSEIWGLEAEMEVRVLRPPGRQGQLVECCSSWRLWPVTRLVTRGRRGHVTSTRPVTRSRAEMLKRVGDRSSSAPHSWHQMMLEFRITGRGSGGRDVSWHGPVSHDGACVDVGGAGDQVTLLSGQPLSPDWAPAPPLQGAHTPRPPHPPGLLRLLLTAAGLGLRHNEAPPDLGLTEDVLFLVSPWPHHRIPGLLTPVTHLTPEAAPRPLEAVHTASCHTVHATAPVLAQSGLAWHPLMAPGHRRDLLVIIWPRPHVAPPGVIVVASVHYLGPRLRVLEVGLQLGEYHWLAWRPHLHCRLEHVRVFRRQRRARGASLVRGIPLWQQEPRLASFKLTVLVLTGFETVSLLEQSSQVPLGPLLLGLWPRLLNVTDPPPYCQPRRLLRLDGRVREARVCWQVVEVRGLVTSSHEELWGPGAPGVVPSLHDQLLKGYVPPQHPSVSRVHRLKTHYIYYIVHGGYKTDEMRVWSNLLSSLPRRHQTHEVQNLCVEHSCGLESSHNSSALPWERRWALHN